MLDVKKRCLSLWVHGYLGEIWKIIFIRLERLMQWLTIEDTINNDYKHLSMFGKYFKVKSLGDYHDLYVQSDTLLLPDIFENVWNKFTEAYELDPADVLSASGLTWQAFLKKKSMELESLTSIDMLKMVAKRNQRWIHHAVHRYTKTNNEYMKDYNKKKNHDI